MLAAPETESKQQMIARRDIALDQLYHDGTCGVVLQKRRCMRPPDDSSMGQ